MAQEGGWDQAGAAGFGDRKLKNTLPLYGNKESMNLNSMILTNILGSPYFKEELIAFKTFHEVVDEIYYKVEHLEPWERNSRKLAGQVGMCAGVRGVAAGGIVSTAFCLLYKLFTLKLTRKQLTAMIKHRDSPYIRGIGFMYIRYSQPPPDFWDWFSPYIDDEEEIDLKAGGGYSVTIGDVCNMMLSKLDWFGTLFPRLPVNVQRDVEFRLKEAKKEASTNNGVDGHGNGISSGKDEWGEAGRRALHKSPPPTRRRSRSLSRGRRTSLSRDRRRSRSHSRNGRSRSRSRGRKQSRSRSRNRRRSRSRSRDKRSRSRERRRPKSRSRERKRSSSKDKHISNSHSGDRGRRRQRSRSKDKRRSRSRDRQRSHSRDRPRNRHNRSSSTERRR